MKKIFTLRLFIASLLSLPLIASAEIPTVCSTGAGFTSIGCLVDSLTTSVLSSLITLFATAAMAAFFYGIVQYIWGRREGKTDKIKVGNDFMVWGLIALFVMFSVWGIIKFGQGIFGIKGDNVISIPRLELKPTGSTYTQPSPLPVGTGSECANLMNGSSCGGGNGTCNNGSCLMNTGSANPSQKAVSPAVGSSCVTSQGLSGRIEADGVCYSLN